MKSIAVLAGRKLFEKTPDNAFLPDFSLFLLEQLSEFFSISIIFPPNCHMPSRFSLYSRVIQLDGWCSEVSQDQCFDFLLSGSYCTHSMLTAVEVEARQTWIGAKYRYCVGFESGYSDNSLCESPEAFKWDGPAYQGLSVLFRALLKGSLPHDCTKLREIDLAPCLSSLENGEWNNEPQICESFFDEKGLLVYEKYGCGVRGSREDFFFYDSADNPIRLICCRDKEISIERYHYKFGEKGRIVLEQKRKMFCNFSVGGKGSITESAIETTIYHWSKNGRRCRSGAPDGVITMTAFRRDGLEKQRISIPAPTCVREEEFYKYDRDGYPKSKKTKRYYPQEDQTVRVEEKYTYYAPDGRQVSGPNDDTRRVYVDDASGNCVLYYELSPMGCLDDLVVREIYYGRGRFFMDTAHCLKHNQRLF